MKTYDYKSKADLRRWLMKRLREPVLERFQRLYVSPKSYEEFKDKYCNGCGGIKKDHRYYFGQTFCGECVQKWDPDRLYEKTKGVKKSWKIPMMQLMKFWKR